MLAIVLYWPALSLFAQSGERPLIRCWGVEGSFSISSGISSDGTSIFAVDGEQSVTSLDRGSGAVNWKAELGGKTVSSIGKNTNSIVIVTEESSPGGAMPASARVRALSKTTGLTRWEYRISGSSDYAVYASDVSVIVVSDRLIAVLDAEKGALRWRRDDLDVSDSTSDFLSGILAVRSRTNRIDLLSLSDGHTIRHFELRRAPSDLALGGGRSVFVADHRGRVFSLDGTGSGSDWEYKTGGAVWHLIAQEDSIVAASADNFIYSISADSGGIRWKRRMPGRISSMNMLGRKRIAVTVVGEKAAFVVDSSNGKVTDQLIPGHDIELDDSQLAGDADFAALLTSNGIFGFSSKCGDEKSGVQGRRF